MTPPTPLDPDPPSMIVIIPDSRLEDLPAVVYAGIQSCEAAYSRGRWFVTVPAALYRTWPVVGLEVTG